MGWIGLESLRRTPSRSAVVPAGPVRMIEMVQVQTEWEFSQERVFIENLFCQRFNFFIVIFSLVIAGAVAANTQLKLDVILWLGFVLCTLVGLTLYRNYVALISILRTLRDSPQTSSSPWIRTH